MKRHQHITTLQSELIQEKKLLPKVVIPTTASHMKLTKLTEHQMLHYTQPLSPPNTPSKQIIHNMLTKRPLSDTEKANVNRIQKDVVAFNFHDELDDSQLLIAELNST